MSVSIPIMLVASVCLAVFAIVAIFLGMRSKKYAAAKTGPGSRDVVAVDLGGRLPAQRRRPCGRHGDSGGNCDNCEYKHEHDDDGHCHGR